LRPGLFSLAVRRPPRGLGICSNSKPGTHPILSFSAVPFILAGRDIPLPGEPPVSFSSIKGSQQVVAHGGRPRALLALESTS